MIFRCCDNKYWCIRDCCGMVCVVFTWLLIFYAEFVVLRVILLPDIASVYSVLNLILFEALAGMPVRPIRNMLGNFVAKVCDIKSC